MRLIDLRLENFRQHVQTEIRFGPGLTGIIGGERGGEVHDPGGNRVGSVRCRGRPRHQ